jgi:hypothetical protein
MTVSPKKLAPKLASKEMIKEDQEKHDAGIESPKDGVAAPAIAQAEAGLVKSRQQKGFQTSRLRKALDKIYPQVLPSREILPDNAIVAKLKLFFLKEGWANPPDRRTIIRLLEKLRPEKPDR